MKRINDRFGSRVCRFLFYFSLVLLLSTHFIPAGNALGADFSLDVRIISSTDDAEESSTGSMYLNSTDLELVIDGSRGEQMVGLRFTGVNLPQNALINQAYLEFETDETDSEPTSLVIAAQDSDNPETFSSVSHDISSRPTLSTSIEWNTLPAWDSVHAKHQSPDIAPLIQEIVNRSGWQYGNGVALIITGTGQRTAESYDGEPAAAPLLHVEYILEENSEAPTIPQNLIAEVTSGSRIDLSWDGSTDNVAVSGYEIFRDGVLAGTSTTTSYSDTGLLPVTIYSYTVAALDPSGNRSGLSTSVAATTHSNTPPLLTFIEPDGTDDTTYTSCTIQWTDEDPDEDAAISLYYDTDNTGADGILIVSGISEDDDGPGDTYIWDTSELIMGDYYVYAVLDDGINEAVTVYSDVPVRMEYGTLPVDDGTERNFFGKSVAIDDDIAVVGDLSNENAYIYVRNGSSWVRKSVLTADDQEAGDFFGASVDVHGDYVIVGAYGQNSYSGAVYIFKREGSSWIQLTKLPASSDYFGVSVSIDGDYAIVGAVYVYKKEDSNWSEQDKLYSPAPERYDQFGESIAIDDTYIIAGSHQADSYGYNSGIAWLFKKNQSTWTEGVKLVDNSMPAHAHFGRSVALDGSFAIIGSPGKGYYKRGMAYLKLVRPITSSVVPDTISLGESSTLSWSAPLANSVIIDHGIGTVPVDGSITVTPTETTTYTITATGYGRTDTVNVMLTIITGYPPPTALISSDENLLNLGDSTTLRWTTSNADTVSIDQGIGTVEAEGAIQVTPGVNTTYTITAIGPGGTVTERVTVTYRAPTVSFSASPEIIMPGSSTSTLSWVTTNAETVSIDQGQALDLNGSLTVSPNSVSTTYTIEAAGPGGTASASVSVAYLLLYMNASPEVVQPGETSTLSWNTYNADTVSMDNGIGTVGTAGSVSVTPVETTTYTLTATCSEGTATESVTVTVTHPPPAISFSAAPETILSGESSTLSWSVSNAETVSIDQGIGVVDPDGSLDVSPAESTTYTITATGPGGTVSETVTVTVTSPITIQITSPLDGVTVSRPDVMVQGTITNSTGNETGVTVNGIAALVSGNQFIAGHVPLEEGENLITATATDTAGNTKSASVTVTADITSEYITITSDTQSGISPLEITLSIEGSFDVTATGSFLSYTGPGDIELLSNTGVEYGIRMTTPGLYVFTAEVEYQGTTYSDSLAVLALDEAELDALLKAKWNGMKAALVAGNVEEAVEYFVHENRQKYQRLYSYLLPHLPEIANSMEPITFLKGEGSIIYFHIYSDEVWGNQTYTLPYEVIFTIDTDGIWRIYDY